MKKLAIAILLIASGCAKQHYTEKTAIVREINEKEVVLSSGDTLTRFRKTAPIHKGDTLIFRYMTEKKMLSRVCGKGCH